MKRSNLKKNIANKSDKTEDKKRYQMRIQLNVVTKLNQKLKKAYFQEKRPKGKDDLTLLTRVFVTMKKFFG